MILSRRNIFLCLFKYTNKYFNYYNNSLSKETLFIEAGWSANYPSHPPEHFRYKVLFHKLILSKNISNT